MKSIPQYTFYKTKYGEELLIDVVTLGGIKQYISKHPVHTLSYFDITFITSDSGRFSIDNEQYALCRGDVLFSKPNEIRAWDKTALPQGYALIFEEEFLLSFFNDHSFIQDLSYFNRDRASAKISVSSIYSKIERLFGDIIAEINEVESRDRHLLRALLYEMLMLLNREYSKDCLTVCRKPRHRHIDHFIKLVDAHFKSYHDTKYYAGQLCVTPNHLNDIVRKKMRVSPKCYIQNRIIQEAKLLLSYITFSVAEIACHLNFENPSYFIRLFRKQTNLTLLQYRRSVIR